MSRVPLLALASAAAFVAGCRACPPRNLAIDYHPGLCPGTFKAPYDATYKLFALDEPGGTWTPVDQSTVERHYRVGFVRQPDGTLVGYVAGRKIPLPEGSYRWQITPETRITRADEVGAHVVRVLGPPVRVLCLIGTAVLGAVPVALTAYATH